MEAGWAKYLDSLDKRLERMEDSLGERLSDLESEVKKISEYKAQMLGRTAAGSFVLGIAIQLAFAYFFK